MSNPKTNILIIGLLATGSSAVTDLLREYEDVHVIPGEFNDYRAPGLVADQINSNEPGEFQNEIAKLTGFKNKLRLFYSIFPIHRFNQGIFRGFNNRLNYSLSRVKQITLLNQLNKVLSSGISTDEKLAHTTQWIRKIGRTNHKDGKFVVFNQPLLPANNTGIWRKVFSPFKLIVVYRNPYDQFAEIVQRGNLMAPYNAPFLSLGSVTLETIFGRSRKSAFRFHIEAMHKRNDWIKLLKAELNKEELLLIDFDDIASENDRSRERIQTFLGLTSEQHTRKGMYFDPIRAKNSININKGILNDEEVCSLSSLNDWYLSCKGE